MYSNPEVNTYLQGLDNHVPRHILNRMVYKALDMEPDTEKSNTKKGISRQPHCLPEHVDPSRARCAYGNLAIPKLINQLRCKDHPTVRRALTTLGDLIIYPEKLVEALLLNLSDSISNFLISKDDYLRERAAMIYVTIANQATGREVILSNLTTIVYLSRGLDDHLPSVRLKIAETLELLAYDISGGDQLCACGFVKLITEKLCNEERDIVIVYLDVLKLLLHRDTKARAIENGTFDELLILLDSKDERVLCRALSCIGILCEDINGKKKAIDVDLLKRLKIFLEDEREVVNIEAARVASFITITTPGKFRILELKMTSTLLYLLCRRRGCSRELLLPIMKTLTNVSTSPEGRKLMLEEYAPYLEYIDADDEFAMEHKHILLNVIRWKP